MEAGPSRETWASILELLDARAPLSAEAKERVLPYLEARVSRWPVEVCQPRFVRGMRWLVEAPWRGLVRGMELDGGDYTSGTLMYLETMGQALPKLTWLALHGWEHELGPKAMLEIARAMPGLRHMDLTGNALSDPSLLQWLQHERAPGLRVLELGDNALTDHSVRAIEASGILERLEYLGLARNRLSPDGVEWLEEALADAGVEEYDMSENALEVEEFDWRGWEESTDLSEFERWGSWDRG